MANGRSSCTPVGSVALALIRLSPDYTVIMAALSLLNFPPPRFDEAGDHNRIDRLIVLLMIQYDTVPTGDPNKFSSPAPGFPKRKLMKE